MCEAIAESQSHNLTNWNQYKKGNSLVTRHKMYLCLLDNSNHNRYAHLITTHTPVLTSWGCGKSTVTVLNYIDNFSGGLTYFILAIYFQFFIQIIHFNISNYSMNKSLYVDVHMKLINF